MSNQLDHAESIVLDALEGVTGGLWDRFSWPGGSAAAHQKRRDVMQSNVDQSQFVVGPSGHIIRKPSGQPPFEE
jgi:hypothetical protein